MNLTESKIKKNNINGKMDNINWYLREISEFELLNEREELLLGEQIYRGSKEAKDKLINANYRLVINIAKKYQRTGIELMDLIQEGNIGLIEAVNKFDYRKGNKFSTYATWWIKQRISRYIADCGRTIRIPVHMVERINKVKKVIREYNCVFGRNPSIRELKDELELSEKEIVRALKYCEDTISLDILIGEDRNTNLSDFIPDDTVPTVEDQVFRKSLREDIFKLLATLTEREKRILILRFGLNDNKENTLEAIGKLLDVTRERIRQIEAKALRKLKHHSRSRKLRDYLDVF